MPIHNDGIAEILENLADLLEIKGANAFRVRAYRNAARTVSGLSRSVIDMLDDDEDLSELPSIGDDLAEKITEIANTGSLKQLEELEAEMPSGLYDLLKIPGLGPKKVKALYEELSIGGLEDLKKAAQDEKIRQLDGFGKKTEKKILKQLEEQSWDRDRFRIDTAEEIADLLTDYLKESGEIDQIAVAGSFRRRKETIGDLDILVTCDDPEKIMEKFTGYDEVSEVISHGDTKSSIKLKSSGMQVDLRVVEKQAYGAALHYFTGSKAHNIAVRKIAQKKDLKVNEYGVFKGDDRIAGKTEEEIFEKLELAYVAPELREDRGEIESAKENKLPDLITLEDIRGDLHSHTKDTDGKFSLEEMVNAAKERGYEYLAISNHSQNLTVAKGYNEKKLREEIERIDRLQEDFDDFVIFKAIEVDILKDGELDLPDSVLKELDFTICSVHGAFNLSREKQTKRILRAMESPYFNVLGHPTGRLINERKAYEVDMEKILEEAKDSGCHLELNAHPKRLDLTDVYCKRAREMGIKVVISTDSHGIDEFDYMRMGIGQARRGWLEPSDVLNTLGAEELLRKIKRN